MTIEWIVLRGYRNFKRALIRFDDKTLIIGANDVGKTNLLSAIRLLLDRSLPETELEPQESDFHVATDGSQASEITITIKLGEIIEDAVLSKLRGYVDDAGSTFLQYRAARSDLSYRTFIGHQIAQLEEVDGRSFLKHIHLRYMQGSRDLTRFIQSEKRNLLRLSKETRNEKTAAVDQQKEDSIRDAIVKLNESVNDLSYVLDSTKTVNEELKKLAYHYSDYSVTLESTGVNFGAFIDQLSLGAKAGERSIGLGGDGRNNQILMALWKAKSEREHDLTSEAMIYCIEEPEAHLHPHQQRKLSEYLINQLTGQVIVTSHSPQVAAEFTPECIVRLSESRGATTAASRGCSQCIKEAWEDMGYRLSILPAEAFFADAVLLVEGPSEVQFYHELARQLQLDLDYLNVSIISVEGVDFDVYVGILNAMEIPWVVRTDNDITKVPRSEPPKWRFSGLNRALVIAGKKKIQDSAIKPTQSEVEKEWGAVSSALNPEGIFVSKKDLENDLGEVCSDTLRSFADTDDLNEAIAYLQGRKAVRMGEYLSRHSSSLKGLGGNHLAQPLLTAVERAKQRLAEKGSAPRQ